MVGLAHTLTHIPLGMTLIKVRFKKAPPKVKEGKTKSKDALEIDDLTVNTSEDVAQEAPVIVEETRHVQNGQDDHIIESEVHQGYSEVDQDQVVQEEQVAQMNGTHEVSETDRVSFTTVGAF